MRVRNPLLFPNMTMRLLPARKLARKPAPRKQTDAGALLVSWPRFKLVRFWNEEIFNVNRWTAPIFCSKSSPNSLHGLLGYRICCR
jgi:hypothetical protein